MEAAHTSTSCPLRLEYCRDGATLSPSAWSSLSSLRTLSFEECPAPPFKVPPSLARSVESLTIMASLGMSVSNVLSDPLHGTWIAEFYNLHQLSVSDVQVNLSNLRVIISSMKHAEQIIFSDTSLRGEIPSKWPSRNITVLHLSHNELQGGIPSSLLSLTKLESMDLSFNNLEGRLPENLDALQNLQYLSLASNQLTGGIPSFIQNLRSLVYIDLSNNLFHGPIPSFFNDMTNLRYIDMRGNYLEGVVPFTESFLQGLNTCKLGANMDLCYNASVIYSIEFMEGVTPCKREKPRDRTSAPSPSPSSSEEDPFRNLPVPQGPSKAIIIIALALSCTVAAILMTICLSRKCAQKDP
ncbi:hypothetical protein KP509_1Z317000 [Ceratopteris richardii]|nr:hypothetical protein KP509_1Z317000 [Ceratopteris richardii]